MIFAQISDIHLDTPGIPGRLGIDSGDRLRRVVHAVNQCTHRPALVLVSGDLVSDPDQARYAYLRELLDELSMPYFLMVGNHDDREMLRRQFADHAYLREGQGTRGGFVQYEIETSPRDNSDRSHRIVVTDTLKDGSHGGVLCDVRLGWLSDMLASGHDTPTVVAMHHPPFAIGLPGIDKYGLENAADVLDVLTDAPAVHRLLSGHVHRAVEFHHGCMTASTCPAVSVSFGLEPDPTGKRVAYVYGPPGFQLHRWNEDGSMLTHTVYV